jgi:hypothetical protein
MSERVYQRGDRVEWDVGKRAIRGRIESVGTGKNEGIATVWQDGYAKSRVISLARLRDCKTHVDVPLRGGDCA